MVKFYGYGLVWDKGSNAVLCEFKDGELTTDNLKVIKKLKALDYKFEELQEAPSDGQDPGIPVEE